MYKAEFLERGDAIMARVKKFPSNAVVNLLRHNRREIIKDRNRNINSELTALNYYLTPDRGGLTEHEYFQKRKAEVYCYGRSDVKVLAGWICPLPAEISDPTKEKEFFQLTYDFLTNRYGCENVVQAVVHYDECISFKKRDLIGNIICDDMGQPTYEILLGRPHLHFCFIPVVPDDNPRHLQTEKICVNDVLNPEELRRFHPEYQQYLADHGVKARVYSGLSADNCPWSVNDIGSKSDIELLRDEIRKAQRWTDKHSKKGW